MNAILLWWGISSLVCMFYICSRLFKFYNNQHPTKKKFFSNGFWLIIWAVILVQISGLFSLEVEKIFQLETEFSAAWFLVQSLSNLLQYIAPLVFAAIGVNLVCHALINKEDLGEMYETSQSELKKANAELDTLAKETKRLKAQVSKLKQEKLKRENVVNIND